VAAELGGARMLFTTRRGGVSTGPYASLNLGRSTQDDPAALDANRDRLAALTGAPHTRFLHGHQVHGTRVRRVTAPPAPGRERTEEDGQATTLAGAPALVVTADCLPVLLAADGAVAALHAGWRGLAGGVLETGVAALRELAGEGAAIHAAVGPGARGCCYEVGEEVHAAFAGVPAARVGARNLDLGVVARARLDAAGVGHVHDTGLCTMCAGPATPGEPARRSAPTRDRPAFLFFSHRRDRGITGRQAGVVWRG
jgi:YfiH family protein